MFQSITQVKPREGAKKGRDVPSLSVFMSFYLVSSNFTIYTFFLLQLVCIQSRTRQARTSAYQSASSAADQATQQRAAAGSDSHINSITMSPVIARFSRSHPRHSSVTNRSTIICLSLRRKDQHRCKESSDYEKNDRFSHRNSLLLCFRSTQYSLDNLYVQIGCHRDVYGFKSVFRAVTSAYMSVFKQLSDLQ